MTPSDLNSLPDGRQASRSGRLVFTLSAVLRERCSAEGSERRLEAAIEHANRLAGNPDGRIDRRKLGRIIKGKNVHLAIDELEAINVYLERHGKSLCEMPFFEPAGPLRSLAQRDRVVFILGSKEVQDEFFRVDMSRWDVAGARIMERAIARHTPKHITDTQDVLLRQDRATAKQAIAEEGWTGSFNQPNTSVVMVGSPRANGACEYGLAEMFEVPVYTDTWRNDPALPFHFCWPSPVGTKPAESALSMRRRYASQIADAKTVQDLENGGGWGLRLGDELLLAEPPKWEGSRTYGVICMQQRASGDLWMAVAGLSGVATYGCSLALEQLLVDFPAADDGHHSPVRIQVVEVHYKDDKPKDLRDVDRGLKWEPLGDSFDWVPPSLASAAA